MWSQNRNREVFRAARVQDESWQQNWDWQSICIATFVPWVRWRPYAHWVSWGISVCLVTLDHIGRLHWSCYLLSICDISYITMTSTSYLVCECNACIPYVSIFSANKPTKRKSFTKSSQSTSLQVAKSLAISQQRCRRNGCQLPRGPGTDRINVSAVGPVLQDDSSSSFLCFLQLLPRLLQKLKNSAATPKLGSECAVKFLILP